MTARDHGRGPRISGGPARAWRRCALAVILPALLTVTACAGGAADSSASGSPSPGAVRVQDIPGSTLAPEDVSGAAPGDLSLAVVVSAAAGDQEQAVLDAIQDYAAAHGDTVLVCAEGIASDEVTAAIASDPDVVIGIGPAVVGAIDLASASTLDRSFLVLGTQLAEPTDNVVAVVWPGAEERAALASEELPFENAAAYAAAAVETGLDAFWAGASGHVISLG